MPTRAELTEAFTDAAVEVLGELPTGLTESSSLAADVGAGSLDMLEIVLVLEEHFDVAFEEHDFEDVITIKDALDRLMLLLEAEA